MAATRKSIENAVDSLEFEQRALEYLNTGENEDHESSWLAQSIQAQPSLWKPLARAFAEAANNAVGGKAAKDVLRRMQLVTAKSVGAQDYIRGGKKEVGGK